MTPVFLDAKFSSLLDPRVVGLPWHARRPDTRLTRQHVQFVADALGRIELVRFTSLYGYADDVISHEATSPATPTRANW